MVKIFGNYLLRLSCCTECMVLISGRRILFKSAGGRSSGQYWAKEGGCPPPIPERLKSPPACTSKSLLINMLYLVCLISGRNTSVKCQVAVLSGSHVPDSPGQELPVVPPPPSLSLQWGKSHAARSVRRSSRGPAGPYSTHRCVLVCFSRTKAQARAFCKVKKFARLVCVQQQELTWAK